MTGVPNISEINNLETFHKPKCYHQILETFFISLKVKSTKFRDVDKNKISEFNFSGYHQILETFFTSLKVKSELRNFFSKVNGEVFCKTSNSYEAFYRTSNTSDILI